VSEPLVAINVRLPVAVHAALVRLAREDDRSLNKQIVYALRLYVGAVTRESLP
jgi:hypothetical protein